MCDASTAVRLCIAGTPAPVRLHAPTFLVCEVTAVLRRIEQGGAATLAQTDEALAYLQVLDVALDVARRLGWARTYDALYVALAQRLGLPLATADSRLRRGAEHLIETRVPWT